MESYISEENSFDIELPNGYISVHVEYAPEDVMAAPTGRYFIYILDDKYGSAMFRLEMDDNGQWISESKPPFVTDDIIAKIAREIATYDG